MDVIKMTVAEILSTLNDGDSQLVGSNLVHIEPTNMVAIDVGAPTYINPSISTLT